MKFFTSKHPRDGNNDQNCITESSDLLAKSEFFPKYFE